MNIHDCLAENISSGRSFVLATLINTIGSVPRDPGAKMIVYSDGTIDGTIGGGNFEKMVIADCLELFKLDEHCLLKHYNLTESGEDATGMRCGGEADVFMELFRNPEKLIIFGAGHIGRNLAILGIELGMKVIVVDSRADMLSSLPDSIDKVLTDSEYEKNFPEIDKDSYVVIVTHGHKNDQIVLHRVAKCQFAYVGMIGSKAKVAKTFSSLEKDGIDRKTLDKVHAPIGLDIGAEGPFEIAVAIIAEIIKERRNRSSS